MVVVVVVSTRGYRDHSDLDVRSYRWLSWRIAWLSLLLLSLLYESDIVPIMIVIVERTMMTNVVIGDARQRRRMTYRTNVPWS